MLNHKTSGSACGRMEDLEEFETAEDNNYQLAKEIFKFKGKERWPLILFQNNRNQNIQI
jgi:hypothetical protein